MASSRAADDIVQIEIIDHDPAAFGLPRVPPPAGGPAGTRPSWHLPVAATVAIAVAVVAVALWQPWGGEPRWRTFPVAQRFPPTLSARQMLGAPPGDAFEVLAPEAPLATAVTRSTLVGHVFADAGANEDRGRWVAFAALPSWNPAAPAGSSDTRVHGIDAVVSRVGVRTSVVWGPLDRYGWTAEASRLTDEEVLQFADHTAVVDAQPALRESYDMRGLQPVGGIAGFRTVKAVERVLDDRPAEHAQAPTVVRYRDGDDVLTLLSIAAPPDTLPFVPFVFGAGDGTTVHGLAAVSIRSGGSGGIVAWMEGGRLVVVAGSGDAARLTALAESTRTATDAEWDELVDMRDQLYIDLTSAERIEIGAGTTPNGNEWRAWSSALADATAFCLTTGLGEQCTIVTDDDRPLDDFFVQGGGISLRVGDALTPTSAIVTWPDGAVVVTEFVRLDDRRSAVAVFVPARGRLEIVEGA